MKDARIKSTTDKGRREVGGGRSRMVAGPFQIGVLTIDAEVLRQRVCVLVEELEISAGCV